MRLKPLLPINRLHFFKQGNFVRYLINERMRLPCFILLFTFSFHAANAENTGLYHLLQDTVKEKKVEAKTIDEVLRSPAPPSKEKAKLVNQVTQYGFKNLFKQFSYDPAIPYAEQVNPNAEIYMQDYMRNNGAHLKNMKKTALPYFNFIDHILSEYGLPRELKYLAVIESDLKSGALSRVGARGPWQFMPYTAKGYGLRVNSEVDDRTDYEKSTHAAAKYLLSLYRDLKDWLLVIAAYNGGTGRVNTAMRKSGSSDFWTLQYYLPEESRNHVKKFIATHYVMETRDDDQAGFSYTQLGTGKPREQPLTDQQRSADSISISGKYKASIIANHLTMDNSRFNALNPGLDNSLSAGADYLLRLPHDKMLLFIADKYIILNECIQSLLKEVNQK